MAEPAAPATPRVQQAVKHFLEQGGWVIATGLGGARFLSAEATTHPVRGLTWTRVNAASLSAITRAAPQITLASQASWDSRRAGFPLYADLGEPIVVEVESGRGRAFWWAAATPLTNAGLREPGNLEFVLASLGPRDARRVLFNESVHAETAGTFESLARSPVKWWMAQAALLALAVIATFSRRSGPIMIPPVVSRLSSVEFVKTLGSLYQRAKAASVTVDIACKRFRFLLARSLGISSQASPEVIERALRHRPEIDAAAVAATVRACDLARERAGLDPKEALSLIQSLNEHTAAAAAVQIVTFNQGSVVHGSSVTTGGTRPRTDGPGHRRTGGTEDRSASSSGSARVMRCSRACRGLRRP